MCVILESYNNNALFIFFSSVIKNKKTAYVLIKMKFSHQLQSRKFCGFMYKLSFSYHISCRSSMYPLLYHV